MSPKLAPNVVPFSLKLHTPASPGSKQQLLGTLRVSSDGRVRADALDSDMQSYLVDMAQKLNRRVVTFAMVGPNADGHFESVTHVVEHDDPEFRDAMKLRVEGEYGLIVEEAA